MYRTIDAAFWTDQKIRKLSPEGRLLFLYLITNPHTHVSGLYYLPLLIAEHESGLSKAHLKSSLESLSKSGLCRYDHDAELILVKKMFRFQGRGLKNTLSAARHLSEDVHKSFLINEFLVIYPEVSQHMKNRVSHTLSDTVSKFGTPEQEQETNPEQEPPIVPQGVTSVTETYPPDFQEFWKSYPKAVGKGAAFKAWKNAKVNGELPVLLAAIASQKKSPQWTRDNGQFIPHPATWLNQRRWQDEARNSETPRASERSVHDYL
jgi:hypothetical protein